MPYTIEDYANAKGNHLESIDNFLDAYNTMHEAENAYQLAHQYYKYCEETMKATLNDLMMIRSEIDLSK